MSGSGTISEILWDLLGPAPGWVGHKSINLERMRKMVPEDGHLRVTWGKARAKRGSKVLGEGGGEEEK